MGTREQKFDLLLGRAGETGHFDAERVTIEPGHSFSSGALTELQEWVEVWIGTRLIRHWDTRDEPPTKVSVTVTVHVG